MTVVDVAAPPPDYYLIMAAAGRPAAVEAILVEEFTRADDHTTVGLDSAGWTPGDPGWWSSAAFSRAMRGDPRQRARVVAADRDAAAAAYRGLGGGALPDETTLRGYFRDHQPLATAAPLRLGPPADDGGEKRFYRVLFAGDPHPTALAAP